MSDTRIAARPYVVGPGGTFFVTVASTAAPAGFAFITSNGASGGVSATTSGTDTRGATFIVFHAAYLSIRIPGVSDSLGNTWISAGVTGFGFDANQLWYCFNPVVSSNHTFTLINSTGSNIFGGIGIAAFSGATANSTIDQFLGSNGANGTTLSASAITPTQNNEVVVASLCFGSAGSTGNITAISDGFTIANQQAYSNNNFQGEGVAYKIQTTAATEDPTWTIDTTYDMTASITCFRVN